MTPASAYQEFSRLAETCNAL